VFTIEHERSPKQARLRQHTEYSFPALSIAGCQGFDPLRTPQPSPIGLPRINQLWGSAHSPHVPCSSFSEHLGRSTTPRPTPLAGRLRERALLHLPLYANTVHNPFRRNTDRGSKRPPRRRGLAESTPGTNCSRWPIPAAVDFSKTPRKAADQEKFRVGIKPAKGRV
jgi:hypothetical protein